MIFSHIYLLFMDIFMYTSIYNLFILVVHVLPSHGVFVLSCEVLKVIITEKPWLHCSTLLYGFGIVSQTYKALLAGRQQCYCLGGATGSIRTSCIDYSQVTIMRLFLTVLRFGT